jgi:hypothetical protein
MDSQHSNTANTARVAATALVLIGCAAAFATHLAALSGSNLNPASSPIGALARTDDVEWFRWGLWLFAVAHIGLILLLNRPGAGRFTRGAQLFLALDAALILLLPWHFDSVASLADPTLATSGGPLWLLGGSVGFAMTCVAGALWRTHYATALFTLLCLLLWSLLAPVFFAIEPDWIGAYQRCVGLLLLVWTSVLAIRLCVVTRH